MTEAANEFVAKMIDRSVFTPNELALCNRIQELEAVLAQKTRECELLEATIAGMHKNDEAQEAQVEQLGRQVAQWKVEYERVDGTNQALASECTDLRRQLAELNGKDHEWTQDVNGVRCKSCRCIDGSTAAAYPCTEEM